MFADSPMRAVDGDSRWAQVPLTGAPLFDVVHEDDEAVARRRWCDILGQAATAVVDLVMIGAQGVGRQWAGLWGDSSWSEAHGEATITSSPYIFIGFR